MKRLTIKHIEKELGFKVKSLFNAIVNPDNLGSVYFVFQGKRFLIKELGGVNSGR